MRIFSCTVSSVTFTPPWDDAMGVLKTSTTQAQSPFATLTWAIPNVSAARWSPTS